MTRLLLLPSWRCPHQHNRNYNEGYIGCKKSSAQGALIEEYIPFTTCSTEKTIQDNGPIADNLRSFQYGLGRVHVSVRFQVDPDTSKQTIKIKRTMIDILMNWPCVAPASLSSQPPDQEPERLIARNLTSECDLGI
jgi:hypothetical protein